MTYEEAELAKANAELKHLERILGEFEIARDLVDTCGVNVLQRAFSSHQARKAALEEDELNPTLKRAFANTPQARGREPIKLFKNRTGIRDTRVSAKPDAPARKFNSIVNSADKDFNRLTAESNELPWLRTSNGRNLSASAVKAVKEAVLRSRGERLQGERRSIEEGQRVAVNNVAESILRRKALQEVISAAAQTIRIPRERTTADLLPLEFANAKGVSVNPPSCTVADHLPDDFKPKITPTRDASFVARTAAAKTLDRTKTMEVPNPETNAQGAVADKFWPHPVPNVEGPQNGNSIGAQTQKYHPNQQKQSFPKKEIEWDNIESGRGYY